MDREKIIRLMRLAKPKEKQFSFEINEHRFYQIQGGKGFPVYSQRAVYQVQGRLDKIKMYVVVEYSFGHIRIDYFTENEVNSTLVDLADKFENLYLSLIYGFWMK